MFAQIEKIKEKKENDKGEKMKRGSGDKKAEGFG